MFQIDNRSSCYVCAITEYQTEQTHHTTDVQEQLKMTQNKPE